MYTFKYKGSYINGKVDCNYCYITDDSDYFYGKRFKSVHAAKIAISKAISIGIPESR